MCLGLRKKKPEGADIFLTALAETNVPINLIGSKESKNTIMAAQKGHGRSKKRKRQLKNTRILRGGRKKFQKKISKNK